MVGIFLQPCGFRNRPRASVGSGHINCSRRLVGLACENGELRCHGGWSAVFSSPPPGVGFFPPPAVGAPLLNQLGAHPSLHPPPPLPLFHPFPPPPHPPP